MGGHVGFAEVELREQMKQAGGKWNRNRKVWELRYEHMVAPKLEPGLSRRKHLIVDTSVERGSIYMWMLRRHLHLDACI